MSASLAARPALAAAFFAGAFVFAALAAGALFLGAAFFAGAFVFAALVAGAFVAPAARRGRDDGSALRRSASSSHARSSAIDSGVSPRRRVALVSPSVT